MDDIKAGVQYIFQTSNPMTLALSATGHAAMECVMTNLLEPGRTVLICNSGIWGVRSADMARRQGATVKEITAEAGTNFRYFLPWMVDIQYCTMSPASGWTRSRLL